MNKYQENTECKNCDHCNPFDNECNLKKVKCYSIEEGCLNKNCKDFVKCGFNYFANGIND